MHLLLCRCSLHLKLPHRMEQARELLKLTRKIRNQFSPCGQSRNICHASNSFRCMASCEQTERQTLQSREVPAPRYPPGRLVLLDESPLPNGLGFRVRNVLVYKPYPGSMVARNSRRNIGSVVGGVHVCRDLVQWLIRKLQMCGATYVR